MPNFFFRSYGLRVTIAVLIVILMVGADHFSQSTPKPVSEPPAKPKEFVFKNLEIIDRPAPGYTESARENRVQGRVRLQVVFLANGQIGDVTVLEPLSNGLTERAVDAAKRIRFRPKMMNGQPMDETTIVEYAFNLYYDDDDDDIRTRVAVTAAPKPVLVASELPATFGGKIRVKVFFSARGNASVFEMPAGLNSDAKAKIEDAIRKIRFRPAVHRSGSRVSVVRFIEYAIDE